MIYGNIHNMEEFSCLEEKIKECFVYVMEHDMAVYEKGSHEIDGERLGALSGLRVCGLYAPYQRLVMAPREIQVQRQVIAHHPLLATYLQYLVKVGNLITNTHLQLLAGRLHNLTR